MFGHCMICNLLFLFEFFVTCLQSVIVSIPPVEFVTGCYLREINNACLDCGENIYVDAQMPFKLEF